MVREEEGQRLAAKSTFFLLPPSKRRAQSKEGEGGRCKERKGGGKASLREFTSLPLCWFLTPDLPFLIKAWA
jgi:hypothetical protein